MGAPPPLLVCRPVEWPTSGPLSDTEPTFIYPGSVIAKCTACRQKIYVGPKIQEAQETTGAPVHCFACGMEVAGPAPTIVNMGNTYRPT